MRKKILWVSTCPFVGGGEQFLVNTLLPLADEFELMGLAATDWLSHEMPDTRLFQHNGFWGRIREVNALVKEQKPDIVLLNGGSALYMAPFLPGKRVLIRHTTDEAVTAGPKRWLYRAVMGTVYKAATRVVHVSQYALTQQRVATEKGIAILNGVVPLPERSDFFIGGRPLRLLYCGRMEREKGVDVLVNAVQELSPREVELHLVGSGSLLPYLKSLSLPNIHVHGFQEDVTPFYKQADVYVQLSSFENCPFSVIDAMSHCLPVIANPCGGLTEMVTPEVTGLYAKQEVADVMGAIMEFVRVPQKVREMGISGHVRCCVRYNQQDKIKAYRDLFKDLRCAGQKGESIEASV